MSRRRIQPVYKFIDPERAFDDLEIEIRVEAIPWNGINTHPNDGGIQRVITHDNDEMGLPRKGQCKYCKKEFSEHGRIKKSRELVCPGDYILYKNGEYWPCHPEFFHNFYEPLPEEEWYAKGRKQKANKRAARTKNSDLSQ